VTQEIARLLLEGALILLGLAVFIVISCKLILRWAPDEARPFVGALFGAAGTIFAAWIAWNAMQQNIGFQKQLAERQEAEALNVITLKLQGPLGILNGFWRAIDMALDANNPHREEWMHFAVTSIFLFDPRTDIDTIKELSSDLHPLARGRLVLVTTEMNDIYCHKIQFDARITEMKEREAWYREYEVFRNQLSNLSVRLAEFGAGSASMFSDRIKTPKLEPSWDALMRDQEERFREILKRNSSSQ
jgi:hypothetical protein